MFLAATIINYQFSQWHFRLFWLSHNRIPKRFVTLILAVMAGLVSVVAAQLAYPGNWSLPGTRIGNQYLGFRTRANISSQIDRLNGDSLIIELGDRRLGVPISNTGLTIDGEATAAAALDYGWKQRLIPFSMFARRNIYYELDVDEPKLNAFAASLAVYNQAPVDAGLKIEGAVAKITSSRSGTVFSTAKTEEIFRRWEGTNALSLVITPVTIEPAISTEAARKTAESVLRRLATPMTVEAAGQSLKLEGSTIGDWMVIIPDQKAKTITVAYDREKIKAALMALSDRVYIAQTPTRVTMLDGEITASAGGSNGQALVVEESVDQLLAAVQANTVSYQAKVQPVTPTTQITRSYTRTSKGIQALINYWVRTHYGQYGVAFQSADGSIGAEYNTGTRFTSASTYKLYLAYVVYTKIVSGEMSLDEITTTGTTVAGCIDSMIVRSDNYCAIALGNRVGWQANDGLLHAKGFTSTTLKSDDHLTTAGDALSWVRQVHDGTLLTGTYNADLISMMKRQIYRSAIPAGAANSVVADKVGDYYSLHHDVAIVYNPKGTYLLSVYSYGASYAMIADLARQINNVMTQ